MGVQNIFGRFNEALCGRGESCAVQNEDDSENPAPSTVLVPETRHQSEDGDDMDIGSESNNQAAAVSKLEV